MVKIKAPIRLKDLECKLGILFKSLVATVSKKELLDTKKIVAISLKREESIVLMDGNDNLWELFKNRKGHYRLKRLKGNRHESEA
jgi:hypothetical protein